ncbi:hypothetical protein FQZ97_865610 [compost metagenome]
MHRALVRTNPAQLAVTGQVAPELAGGREEIIHRGTHDQMTHGENRLTANVVAASNGEGETVALQRLVIRIKDNIGRRVVRVRVHRVRAVQTLRSREAEIEDAQISNFRHDLSVIRARSPTVKTGYGEHTQKIKRQRARSASVCRDLRCRVRQRRQP